MKKEILFVVAMCGVMVGCGNNGSVERKVENESVGMDSVIVGEKIDSATEVVQKEKRKGKEKSQGIESATNYEFMLKRAWENVRRVYNSAVYRNDNAEFPMVGVYGWELIVSPSEDGRKANVSMNHQATMAAYVNCDAESVEMLGADTYQDGNKVTIIRCKGLKIKARAKDGKEVEVTLTGDKAVVAKEGKEEIWMQGSVDGKERKQSFGENAGIEEMVTAICGSVSEGKEVLEDAVEVLKGKKSGLDKVVDRENGYLKVEFGEGALFWGVEANAWECESGARIVMMQWSDMEGIVRTRLYRVDVKEGVLYEIANTMSETDAETRREYGLDTCDWEYVLPKKEGEVVIQWHISKSGEKGKMYWYFDKGRNRFDVAG